VPVVEKNIGSLRLLLTEDYAGLSRAGADLIVEDDGAGFATSSAPGSLAL
jgi:hypothetical protein